MTTWNRVDALTDAAERRGGMARRLTSEGQGRAERAFRDFTTLRIGLGRRPPQRVLHNFHTLHKESLTAFRGLTKLC